MNIYTNRKRMDSTSPHNEAADQQPSMDALRSGAAQPTAQQMGHRVDLPEVMREKMESAFGADLSAVKLYESETVADAGTNAVTQGSNIAFAPGMLDFTSYGGQALLGHEISHVVSQQRGEVSGGGFLNDHALEARADREGAAAAAGQQVAMPEAAMSYISAAPAAGPMQADKRAEKEKAQHEASEMSVAFNNHIFNPSYQNTGGHEEGRDRFEALAAGTSKRGVKAVNRMVREKQKIYERQKRGEYTMSERYGGALDRGIFESDSEFAAGKDRELLSLLNMQRALQNIRSGKSYSVSHQLSDFTDRNGDQYSNVHGPGEFRFRKQVKG